MKRITISARKILLASLTAAMMFASASAFAMTDEQKNQVKAAYNRGDYVATRNIIEPLAKQGDADAQFSLGLMYLNGYGVAQDYKKMLYWWEKAANQEYAEAQYNLGVIYSDGQGVTQDYNQAITWYQKAANQKHAKALFNLSIMYGEGKGVKQDFDKAEHFLILAALQGLPEAKIALKTLYEMRK